MFAFKESNHLMFSRKVQQGGMFYTAWLFDLEKLERKPAVGLSITQSVCAAHHEVFRRICLLLISLQYKPIRQGFRTLRHGENATSKKPKDAEEKNRISRPFISRQPWEHVKVYGLKKPDPLEPKSKLWSLNVLNVTPSIYAAFKNFKMSL